jgi:signal transduction histidine kinase
MALNYVCFVPLAARNPGLPPDAMRWLVLGFYVAAGGNITLIHFSLIFPEPKGFLKRFPRLNLVPYAYFGGSALLYATGAIAFGSTFPFLVFWVLLMIGALLHTMFSQSDRFLRQQSLLAALAPLYVGLFYVLLTLLPTVLRNSANDYALYASVTLILPFTLAFAAETTELYAAMQREEAQAQAERLRISRDLHDSVGGDLTAIKLFAEEAQAQAPGLPPSLHGLVESIRDTASRSLAQVRGFIWAIDPRECSWAAFAQRMRRTGEQLLGPLGTAFELQADLHDGPAAHPHLLYQIMGVYQESLNNIAKHAAATRVGAHLRVGPEGVWMSVRDDGRGGARDRADGYGARSMKERAASVGAELTVANASPCGTEVTLRLPARPRVQEMRETPPAGTPG